MDGGTPNIAANAATERRAAYLELTPLRREVQR